MRRNVRASSEDRGDSCKNEREGAQQVDDSDSTFVVFPVRLLRGDPKPHAGLYPEESCSKGRHERGAPQRAAVRRAPREEHLPSPLRGPRRREGRGPRAASRGTGQQRHQSSRDAGDREGDEDPREGLDLDLRRDVKEASGGFPARSEVERREQRRR